MFFELSQFCKFFIIEPVTWIIVSLIIFLCVKNKITKYIFLTLTILMFLFFTNSYILDYVKYRLTEKYSSQGLDDDKIYDAAIVMGGFSAMNKQTGQIAFVEGRADRILEAVRLYNQGKIKKILITGDPSTLYQTDGTTNAECFLGYMENLGVPNEAFILEQYSRNTRENACNTNALIDSLNLNKENLLLITSALHIDRSLDAFSKVDIYPQVYAVGIYDHPGRFAYRSLYPSWKTAVNWAEIMNEGVGRIAYRAMGYN